MKTRFSFVDFVDELPPFMARSEVPKLLGGVVSAKTLANKDSLDEGPGVYKRVGGKVVYRTIDLLEWFDARSVAESAPDYGKS